MKQVFLFAPEGYWQLSQDARNELRCGPGRGIIEVLVPDIWRWGWPIVDPLSVQPACSIHDWYYRLCPGDCKAEADEVLLNNLIRLVEAAGGPMWVVRHRLWLCRRYYEFVDKFGGPAFWSERNKPSEMGLVTA